MLFFPLPHDPAKVDSAWEQDTGCRGGFYEEHVTLDPKVSSLLSSVPGLIPGGVDHSDKVTSFDAVFACVCKHGSMQFCPLEVSFSRLAMRSGGYRTQASLWRQYQIAFRIRTKEVVSPIVDDDLR
jgi:hypothetical protein